MRCTQLCNYHHQLIVLLLLGIVSVLETVRSSNDLDHPLCQHLRKGNWYINYILTRLGLLHKVHTAEGWHGYYHGYNP